MTRFFTLILLGALLAAGAYATPTPATPEIDPASGINALVLLGGGLLLIRRRSKR